MPVDLVMPVMAVAVVEAVAVAASEKKSKVDSRCNKLREPFFLQWHITDKCNLTCKHCYGEYGIENDKTLSTQECFQVIDQYSLFLKKINSPGRIHFTGGEPFLRPDFFNLVKYARKKRLHVRVLSNGTVITEKIAQKLKNFRVQAVQVSIDGTKEIHDSFRCKKGSFEKTWEGIAHLNKAGVSTTVSTTVSKINIDTVPEIIDLCLKHNVDRVGFSRLVPYGRGKDIENEMLSIEETKKLFSYLHKQRKKLKGKLDIPPRDPVWWLMLKPPQILCSGAKNQQIVGGCSIGTGGLALLSDGDILACRRLPVSLGNIRETSFTEIWKNSPILEELRDRNKLNGNCGRCGSRFFCGGCRAIAYGITNNYLDEDPQCWNACNSEKSFLSSFYEKVCTIFSQK